MSHCLAYANDAEPWRANEERRQANIVAVVGVAAAASRLHTLTLWR